VPKVAVKLPVAIGEVGDYLADVTALEAAGAHAVWVEDSGPDPWVTLGALSAITHRMVLGCVITSPEEWPAAQLGRAAGALQALSRGRIVVGLPPEGIREDQLDALRGAGVTIFGSDYVAGAEKWLAIHVPTDREAWNEALAACDAAGATGVIVPWSDRLIDLLRNPEPDDRSDLLISTG
jgi:luciferase-like monooxygenase